MDLEKRIKELEEENFRLREMIGLNNGVNVYQLGFEDLKGVQYYKDELNDVKEKIRHMLISKSHYKVLDKWYVGGDSRKGDNLMNFFINMVTSSYNLMVESNIKSANISNQQSLSKKFTKMFDYYNETLSKNGLQLNNEYLNLILTELDIYVKISLAKQNEKDLEYERKEILKEQARAEAEIKKNKEKLELKLLKLKNEQLKGKNVNDSIEDIEKQLEENNYKLEHTRAGYVYIIQSKSFTDENQVKIGMTRQVPQNRLDQLSDASIPFKYYPLAFIYTDDAFELETKLHRRLKEYKVNKFNQRKEHFIIDKNELLYVLNNEFKLNVEFKDIVDEEWLYSEVMKGE